MAKNTSRKRAGRTAARKAALIVLLASVAGCAQTKSWIDRVTPGGDRDRDNEPVILGAPTADDYLRELDELATGDPATQIEIFSDAESRATLTPDPSTTLRFALVLATPGHSESDPERAQSMLREALTQSALMTPAEIALAEIHLRSVEERIVLEAEARRLRASSSRQAQTQEQAMNQRLQSVEAENRRLRAELADAESKLEALTSIERDIREQDQ
ncbi:MAG: hypothetical protein QNI99_14215 [Woeseiaceae bacterium]|nr:hypothetical protein [Woeseiaceae bacterium]